MNKTFCYVVVPNLVVRLSDFTMFKPEAFVRTQFNNWYYEWRDDRKKPHFSPIAGEWMEKEDRNQRDRFTYEPGREVYVDGMLNIWRPYPVEAKKGDIKPWVELGRFLFPKSEDFAYLEKWFAYPLQHPGVKIYVAPVLFGEQGLGKNILVEAVQGIYGPNATQISLQRLLSDFNPWHKGVQLVVGNEIRKSHDRGAMYDKIKDLITAPTIWVNEKNKGEYELPNMANFVFTTNNEDAFYLSDTDRRFFVPHITKERPLPANFYTNFRNWKNSDKGKAALYYHFLRLDSSDFNPTDRAPMTLAKQAIIEEGWNAAERWAHSLAENIDDLVGASDSSIESVVGPIALFTESKLGPIRLFTMDELLKLFGNPKYSEAGMSRALKRAGFEKAYNGNSIRLANGKKHVWVIVPKERMAGWLQMSEGELRTEYWRQRWSVHNSVGGSGRGVCRCQP